MIYMRYTMSFTSHCSHLHDSSELSDQCAKIYKRRQWTLTFHQVLKMCSSTFINNFSGLSIQMKSKAATQNRPLNLVVHPTLDRTIIQIDSILSIFKMENYLLFK